MGEHDKALDYLQQSIDFAKREARWGVLAVSLIQTAFVHQDHGHYDRALAAQRRAAQVATAHGLGRSEEHTSELQSLMRISYAVFCLKKKKNTTTECETI